MDSRETKATLPAAETPARVDPGPSYKHDPFVRYQYAAFVSLVMLAVVVCMVPRGAATFLCWLLGLMALADYVSATIDRHRWRRNVEQQWLQDYLATIEPASRSDLRSEMSNGAEMVPELSSKKVSPVKVPKRQVDTLAWTRWQHVDPAAPLLRDTAGPSYRHDPYVVAQFGTLVVGVLLAISFKVATYPFPLPIGSKGGLPGFLLGLVFVLYVWLTIERHSWRRRIYEEWLGHIRKVDSLPWARWERLDSDAPLDPYRARLAKYLGVAESEVLVPEPRPQSKMAFWCLVPISRGATLKSLDYIRQVLHRIHHAVHGNDSSARQR